MAAFCTNCGSELMPGAVFCTNCGTKVSQSAPVEPPAPAAEPALAPSAQTPPAPHAPTPQGTLCPNCGKVLAEDIAFCTECGTRIQPEPAASAQQTYTPPAQPAPAAPVQQAYEPPVQPAPVQQPKAVRQKPLCKPVGTGAFFGLQLLFGIPLIGWILCIVMAFAPKNLNIRHYARARLIWLCIGLAIGVLLWILGSWVWEAVVNYAASAGFTGGM